MNLNAEMRRLRELDWRELDIKEAGVWPWSLQLLLCLLTLGVTFFAMHWYLAAPAKAQLEQVRAEEPQLIRAFRTKAALAARLEPLREQVEALEVRMDELREMLPSGAEIPALLDNITETALDNQLTIDYIRLRGTAAQEHYVVQPFDIQVRGDYHRIAAFLAGVAGLPRIVTLHDMTLSPEGDNGHNLRLALVARTYSYRKDAEGDS
ncbi:MULTISPECIES: type 4a pilus biogenesis protein PilO [Halomonas]|uniref:Type 4a pilus biogenesis protein PilO n=2 Tax=Halomonas TaxID=2745 RepID=A0A7X4W2F0_9GAMM|nr:MULTISPECIES: type 4a pilus biogenesis protein PilO [Halomonas]MDR5900734.1 type 4a pilus biogenesis protein PilO [Halomonas icarae]NAW13798.1 type 4a pilus biogenesis protein PilO [Halomonas icarae]TDB02631.1 pilus assembly protein PilO [Halomonas marinisediminis]